ncbi:MAG: hypothetical protein EOO47_00525 [Flavobacterium sp.]|nr:MAG: hypothetical protein EOO47_00525 [Flavobacterium sp.]
MISLVTSTIIPAAYSFFSVDERYLQTLHTLTSLSDKGFDDIYIFDNSIADLEVDRILGNKSQKVKLLQNKQYCFANKGLNEALLILNHLAALPDNVPIFKISGRYYATEKFQINNLLKQLGDKDILGICKNIYQKVPYFSTRSYLTKNKQVLEKMLILSIEEMIAYGRDSNTFSGILKKIFTFLAPKIGTPFQLSLEQAFARIVKHHNNCVLVDEMNIAGYVAGSTHQDFISE